MKTRTTVWIIVLLFGLTLLSSAAVYGRLPEQIATHWNAAGAADGFSSRSTGLWVLPGIMLLTGLLFLFIPAIDPLRKNIEQFRPSYNAFIAVTVGFLFLIHVFSLAYNLGLRVNANLMLAPVIAGILYASGLLMQRSKRNWFIGVRNPWTLSSDEVWHKTHQRAALLFKIAAAISLFGLLFPGAYLYILVIPLLIVVVYVYAYSYFVFRRIA